MNVVIFNALQTSLNGGIGRYSYELAKAIYIQRAVELKIVIREEDMELFKFADSKDLIVAKNIGNSIKRNYYEQFILPKLIYKKFPQAIIHYPDSMAPILAKNKIIITIHDLAFKTLRNAFTFKTTLWKNIITKLSVNKADCIIAITNFSKHEILKYYNVDLKKIHVVYNGFNDFSKESIDYGNISEKLLELRDKKYILTVSTISPRKNIDGLIKAFNKIKDKFDCDLVVVGANGWMYQDVYKIVDNYKLNDRVIFAGKVNDDELKFLYKNAEVFVYPSFYEGFGLPPLEAMSFNLPIIVSNVTSMPEVIGDNGIYIDPYDINDIAIKINDLINNTDRKKTSINCDYKKYSWEKCADGILKIYNGEIV